MPDHTPSTTGEVIEEWERPEDGVRFVMIPKADYALLTAQLAERDATIQTFIRAARAEAAQRDRLEAQLLALQNNVERAIAILTPLFVQAQEHEDPDEEVLGGALDVLSGWFGQNGKPLRRLEELEVQLAERDREIERLMDGIARERNRTKALVVEWREMLANKDAEIERLRHIHCECEYSEPCPNEALLAEAQAALADAVKSTGGALIVQDYERLNRVLSTHANEGVV